MGSWGAYGVCLIIPPPICLIVCEEAAFGVVMLLDGWGVLAAMGFLGCGPLLLGGG
jgi:hypothetical protein